MAHVNDYISFEDAVLSVVKEPFTKVAEWSNRASGLSTCGIILGGGALLIGLWNAYDIYRQDKKDSEQITINNCNINILKALNQQIDDLNKRVKVLEGDIDGTDKNVEEEHNS